MLKYCKLTLQKNKVIQLALLQMPEILLSYPSLDHVILVFVINIYMYDVFTFLASRIEYLCAHIVQCIG